jgi:hypothetical protein
VCTKGVNEPTLRARVFYRLCVTSEKDHRVGRRIFRRSAIEGEGVRLAVDFNPNSSGTIAVGSCDFNALNDLGTGEGIGRKVCKVRKSDHALQLANKIAIRKHGWAKVGFWSGAESLTRSKSGLHYPR